MKLFEIIKHRAPFMGIIIFFSIVASIFGWINPSLTYFFGFHTGYLSTLNLQLLIPQLLLFQFFHAGVLHLLSNLFFLVYFWVGMEVQIGKKNMFLLFLFSTFSSVVALSLFSSGVTIGISTYCMAILAYHAMVLKSQNNPEFKWALMFLFLNIAIGITGNISLAGHLGGAIGGMIFFFISHTKK